MRSLTLVVVSLLALCVSANAACSSQPKILIWGDTIGSGVYFRSWLRSQIPNSVVDQRSSFSNLGLSVMTPYHLVIFAALGRDHSSAEADNVVQYVDQGGAVLSLAGFYNDPSEGRIAESVLRALGTGYDTSKPMVDKPLQNDTVYNSPIGYGLSNVSFVTGWRARPYTGPGKVSYVLNGYFEDVGARVDIGQTIERPSGGRALVWGDEWITFAPPDFRDVYNLWPGTPQFWRNAVFWLTRGQVCPPGANVPSGPCDGTAPVTVVPTSCASAAASTTGKALTLKFDASATGPCGV